MRIVDISREDWATLVKHASECFPQECTGMFECFKERGKPLKITMVYPCRNIAKRKKYSSQISKKDMRKLRPVLSAGAKMGYAYGVYHSHPNTGTIQLSDRDMFSGKLYKRFRMQVVIGITKTQKIKRAFWKMNKSGWSNHEIRIQRN